MKSITKWSGIVLVLCYIMNSVGQTNNLIRLKEIAQRFEAITIQNPKNAKEELGWLLGSWHCVAFAFPKMPEPSDSYAMLGRIEIVENDLRFPGHYPDSVMIYAECYYTTNISGYRPPKNETAIFEFRKNDFTYRHGDFFFLKRPMTNNPSVFLIEHKNGGGLLLFQRLETTRFHMEGGRTNRLHND